MSDENICLDCGQDCSFGSGCFVNRIPKDDGWMCGDCVAIAEAEAEVKKLKIMDEISSMNVDNFQTLCERHNIGNDVVAEIDIAIGELVNCEFEDRSR